MRLPAKHIILGLAPLLGLQLVALTACRTAEETRVPVSAPTAAPTTIFAAEPDRDGMRAAIPALAARQTRFETALAGTPPILPLEDSGLDEHQRLAQDLALQDAQVVSLAWSVPDHLPLRNEVFAVYPARESDITEATTACHETTCYRVEIYNYAENMTTVAMVDNDNQSVLDVTSLLDTQPDLNEELTEIAWQIALNTPEVVEELRTQSADVPIPEIERILNKTACEQSRHLCAAPTFYVGERALWVIVDLADEKVVGMRWTDSASLGGPPLTEAILLGEDVYDRYCRQATSLARNGWEMDYLMTSSDGLLVSDVLFQGQPILHSAKVVDWHVSYDREEAFGYSDAVGCPFFSSAAVVAMEAPTIEPLEEDGEEVGFVIVQEFVHPLWPAACMYNYEQRYEFYNDGRFRIAVASNGGGCGDDGTYRPVVRIVPAGDALTFAEWDGEAWAAWETEHWQLQDSDTPYTPDGYQYRLTDSGGSGYYLEPGQGQFGDGGRGDNAYVYVTRYNPDEGDADMMTIGPCCNTNHEQGPEKYIEQVPDEIASSSIVLWYVAQLKNDDTPGGEYCWASADVEDGMYVTSTWPCYAGPMFIPVDE
jgi:hypothetical protein